MQPAASRMIRYCRGDGQRTEAWRLLVVASIFVFVEVGVHPPYERIFGQYSDSFWDGLDGCWILLGRLP